MTALELIFSVLLYGGLVYVIGLLPIEEPFPKIARIVVTVLFVLHVLNATGLLGGLDFRL